MSHPSQSVQDLSESECESESGSESGSASEEEEVVECGPLVPVQRSDARELRQCGSAVHETACGQPPALDAYFARLTKQYNYALSMDGHTDHKCSCQTTKQWKEESGCTCNSHKSHSNTNRSTGYAQNNNNGCTYSPKENRMVPIGSKPTTPKKGKEEYGYPYYESTSVNNGRVGHVGKYNNDSRYISQEYSTVPQSSLYKLNKGKIESVYDYDEHKFDNNRHAGYDANYLGASYSIPRSTCKPKPKKETLQSGCAYEESEFDNNQHVEYTANYLKASYTVPSLTCKTKPKKEKKESGCAYDESDFDNNQYVEYGPKKNYRMMYNG